MASRLVVPYTATVSIAIRCAREIAANLLMGIPAVSRARARAGRTSLAPTSDNLRRFAFGIVDDNPDIASRVAGADVCEIGPGDHLATGLVLLAAGARSYTVLDRFPGDYDGPAARAWYALVCEHRPCNIPDFPACARRISRSVEDVDSLPVGAFDLVVSQAVGEHVTSVPDFARATHRMLRPGGVAVHNVDFSNHGICDGDEFLAIPEWVWRLMGSNRGLPNRKRRADFEQAFASYFDVHVPRASATWASFVLTRGCQA